VDHNHKWTWASGTVLLIGHPDKATVVDDDTVLAVAYPIGKYEYTSVNKSKKTILKYTASLDEAVRYWTTTTVAEK
jgi:hypothetical protein